jgi:CO/xanthine dehydrogenase Mo-binding subunit
MIGESVPMLDSLARVTGAVEYMVNLRLPDMLFGKIVRSQSPHAKLLNVDVTRPTLGKSRVLSRFSPAKISDQIRFMEQ